MTLVHGHGVGRSSKASSARDLGTEKEQPPTLRPAPRLLCIKFTSSSNFITFMREIRRLSYRHHVPSFGTHS